MYDREDDEVDVNPFPPGRGLDRTFYKDGELEAETVVVDNETCSASMEALRGILANKSLKYFYWPGEPTIDHLLLVDVQTANAMMTVYEAFGQPESREKFERMLTRSRFNFQRLAAFCWEQFK